MAKRVTAFLCATLVFSCFLLAPRAADIEDNNYEGSYKIVQGTAECRNTIKFEDDGGVIDAREIRIDGSRCTGDDIIFGENPSSGAPILQYLETQRVPNDASWVSGTTSGNLTCDEKVTLAPGTRFTIFVFDDDDIKIAWKDLLGDDSPLPSATATTTFKFKEDTVYMFLDDSCLYKREGLLDKLKCFPASATALLESGTTKRMDQLKIGDRVLVADGTYSDVFMFTHRDRTSKSSEYVRLFTADHTNITLTWAHYIYATGKLIQASQVREGDLLRKSDGSEVAVVRTQHHVHDQGLYNPQTLHGDIVVDGFVASTYTSAIPPKTAHGLLAPLRAAYRFFSGTAIFKEL